MFVLIIRHRKRLVFQRILALYFLSVLINWSNIGKLAFQRILDVSHIVPAKGKRIRKLDSHGARIVDCL